MIIQLDEPETEARAKRLAHLTGQSIEQLVAEVLKEKEQDFDWREHDTPEYLQWKFDWYAQLDARHRTLDPRTWREIEDQEIYDEYGCPFR